jgi:argininosuccinate lyase
MKMWSGRFRQPLDPAFERWQRSFPFDRRLLGEEVAASRAHAAALGKAGVLSPEEAQSILEGLDRLQKDVEADPSLLDDPSAEDVHHFVEEQLVARIGETGYKLHSGRSRNEQIATDLRLFTRGSVDAIRAALAELIAAFVEKARAQGAAAMPAYTHLQRAEPVLVAHWLLAYVEMFFRDADRLADCRKRANVLPLGSGAVAGSTLPLDRAAMARELGCEGVSANSLDVTCDRDFALEFVNALSLLALHLSRLAEEMTLFATAEYGFVRLPEPYSTGSSALPQKKNPDSMELLRAQIGRVSGASVSLLVAMKGLPLAYNKDLQEMQAPLFAAVDAIREALPIAAGFVRQVEFDKERMQQAAGSSFMNALSAANYLVRRGVPFRRAHAVIGEAVQLCLEKGCALDGLSLEELRQLNPEFGPDFSECLTLEASLAAHDIPGGTAPARVQTALKVAEQRLAVFEEASHARA